MIEFVFGVVVGQFSVLAWMAFMHWLSEVDGEDKDTHLQ
jgi:hypothetical protein